MGDMVNTFFNVSDLLLKPEGLLSGLGAALDVINGTIQLAYKRGLFDGAVAGAIATMLLMPNSKSQVIVLKESNDAKRS